MKEFENNAYFWQKVDAAYMSGDYKTLYKKGTVHPTYHELIFPADYGHVKMENDDESSLKVFRGSKGGRAQAVVLCANVLEKALNAIALIGLSEEETEEVLKFLNSNEFQKSVIIRRGKEIPSWAEVE